MNFSKTLILLTAINLVAITGPALAQSAPSVPTQLSAPVTTAIPTAAPTLSNPPATPISTASEGDIHDIRGPISIPYPWLWAMYVVGGVALAGALYAAWRFFRRHAAKAKLPFEIALERLEAARALMTPSTVREYAFAVSEIIRVYIEQRFGEKAAHRTTEEFMSDLLAQTGTPLALHHDRLADFLGHCDLTKFARWQLSVPEMESMHESARVFILDTWPQPEPAKAKGHSQTPAMPDLLAQPELIESK
jgi:hypothetical protein